MLAPAKAVGELPDRNILAVTRALGVVKVAKQFIQAVRVAHGEHDGKFQLLRWRERANVGRLAVHDGFAHVPRQWALLCPHGRSRKQRCRCADYCESQPLGEAAFGEHGSLSLQFAYSFLLEARELFQSFESSSEDGFLLARFAKPGGSGVQMAPKDRISARFELCHR